MVCLVPVLWISLWYKQKPLIIPNGSGLEGKLEGKGWDLSVFLYKALGNVRCLFSGTNNCSLVLVSELLYMLFSAILHIAKTKMLHLFHLKLLVQAYSQAPNQFQGVSRIKQWLIPLHFKNVINFITFTKVSTK